MATTQEQRQRPTARHYLTDSAVPLVERRPVPAQNMNLNLSSNNPFRRQVSPSHANPSQSYNAPPLKPSGYVDNNENRPPPRSTNPFLDNYVAPSYPVSIPSQNAQRSPSRPMPPPGYSLSSSPKKPAFGSSVPTQMMNGMNLNDRTQRRSPPRGGPPSSFRPIPTQAPANHRHSRSNDENQRAGIPPSPEKLIDIFATPEKEKTRHTVVRRNSETSVLDVRLDEQRERRKAREARARDGKAKDPKKPMKPNRQMDLIDKLDVTSIYGTGMFHHDGPFDACNPHRNRRGGKSAPMQAFPEGSANNTMGGSGPVNKFDMDRYHGRVPDASLDFNSTNAVAPIPETSRLQRSTTKPGEPMVMSGAATIEQVHGQQSTGLGTSTFLEGAPVPASRLALQRATSEQENGNAGGLTRKKSLAQRFRGMSRPRQQGFGDAGRVISPEARYVYADDNTPPVPAIDPQSAGGRGRMVEVNPFFNEQGETRQPPMPQTMKTMEVTQTARSRGLSSPSVPLFTMKTNDSTGGSDTNENAQAQGGGLLSRMKSLRGGRRPRGERRES